MKYTLLVLALFSCGRKDHADASKDNLLAPLPSADHVADDGKYNLLTYKNEGDLDLISVTDYAALTSGNKLIGGTPADRKDWPASFTTSQGNSRCTGTLLGPQVLQTAAHCVGNGGTATLSTLGKKFTSKCTHHSRYRVDPTADFALCLITEPVDAVWFESVQQTNPLKVGDKLTLAGMGCTQPGGSGGNNDVFRVGEAPVVSLPNGDNDIVTRGSGALCYGDSGGSAFWKDEKGVFKVIGINSRGNIKDTSYLPALFSKDAVSFYKSWSQANSVKVCGQDADAVKCRGASVVPPPPPPVVPLPAWCQASFDKVKQCLFGAPRLALTDPVGCQKAHAELFACQVIAERADGTVIKAALEAAGRTE